MIATEFAEAAHTLQGLAHEHGLTRSVAFRSPPAPGLERSVKDVGLSTIVAVRIRDRDAAEVHVDMVAGMLAANGRTPDDPLRYTLLDALGPRP